MNSSSKQKNNLLIIAVLTFCAVVAVIELSKERTLKKSHAICNGYIKNYNSGGTGNANGIWIDYSINVNGKTYNSSSLYRLEDLSVKLVKNHFLNKNVTVIYNPNDPSTSSLMILPKDFKENGYDFPDSLKWILPYIKDK
jgi:hypothetical protein